MIVSLLIGLSHVRAVWVANSTTARRECSRLSLKSVFIYISLSNTEVVSFINGFQPSE